MFRHGVFIDFFLLKKLVTVFLPVKDKKKPQNKLRTCIELIFSGTFHSLQRYSISLSAFSVFIIRHLCILCELKMRAQPFIIFRPSNLTSFVQTVSNFHNCQYKITIFYDILLIKIHDPLLCNKGTLLRTKYT